MKALHKPKYIIGVDWACGPSYSEQIPAHFLGANPRSNFNAVVEMQNAKQKRFEILKEQFAKGLFLPTHRNPE